MYMTFRAGAPCAKTVSFPRNLRTTLPRPAESRKACASKTGTFAFLSFLTIAATRALKPSLTAKEDYCLWGIQHGQEFLSQSKVILELLNHAIALTGGFFEFPAVHNLHCTPHVFYDSLFLQYCRCHTHGGSVSTHHGGNEIVGDWENAGVHPILSHQQPPRETLLDIVQAIARRGLCDLHPLQPRMPVQNHL